MCVCSSVLCQIPPTHPPLTRAPHADVMPCHRLLFGTLKLAAPASPDSARVVCTTIQQRVRARQSVRGTAGVTGAAACGRLQAQHSPLTRMRPTLAGLADRRPPQASSACHARARGRRSVRHQAAAVMKMSKRMQPALVIARLKHFCFTSAFSHPDSTFTPAIHLIPSPAFIFRSFSPI